MEDWEKAGREAGKKAILKLRYLASGDKKRLQSQEYDLDLTYITPTIIAMAFPAENALEQAYRNAIEDVSLYLESTHGGHYMIFNLSAEKQYDPYHFNHNVINLGWPDHHSPPLRHLFVVCKAMHEFLKKHPSNVAVVHCKAGKGRTGTAIAAYFLYSGQINDPSQALETFARGRSSNMNGVTVPSQRRYVYYMDKILKGVKSMDVLTDPAKVTLNELILEPVPDFFKVGSTGAGIKPAVEFAYADDVHNAFYEWKLERTFKSDTDRRICFKFPITFTGDIYIRVFHHQTILGKTAKKMMFRFAFHTSFIEDDCLVLDGATELDSPSHGRLKAKKVPPRFRVILYFNQLTSKVVRQRELAKRQPSSSSSEKEREKDRGDGNYGNPSSRIRSSRDYADGGYESKEKASEPAPSLRITPAPVGSEAVFVPNLERQFGNVTLSNDPSATNGHPSQSSKLVFDPSYDYQPHGSSSKSVHSNRSPSSSQRGYEHPQEHFQYHKAQPPPSSTTTTTTAVPPLPQRPHSPNYGGGVDHHTPTFQPATPTRGGLASSNPHTSQQQPKTQQHSPRERGPLSHSSPFGQPSQPPHSSGHQPSHPAPSTTHYPPPHTQQHTHQPPHVNPPPPRPSSPQPPRTQIPPQHSQSLPHQLPSTYPHSTGHHYPTTTQPHLVQYPPVTYDSLGQPIYYATLPQQPLQSYPIPTNGGGAPLSQTPQPQHHRPVPTQQPVQPFDVFDSIPDNAHFHVPLQPQRHN